MALTKEILKSEELVLPIIYDKGTCEDEIISRIKRFLSLLKKNNIAENGMLERIAYFVDHLERMFSEYYLGHHSSAYTEFQMGLSFLIQDMTNTLVMDLQDDTLYRARINEDNIDYKNDEMFHIKYSQRGKVSTQRFSFPGLPCLYLAGSTYVCWLELNRPSFEDFQVASISVEKADGNVPKVLDLSINPATFYCELEKREKCERTEHPNLSLEQYLLYWPFIAACSIAVKNENDPFKPEYIFPQFLLQIVLEERIESLKGVDGIKYMSIKAGRLSMRQYESDYRTYTNYVFPIQSSAENPDGFCNKLCKFFRISNNLSGRELQVISDIIRRNGNVWNSLNGDEKNCADEVTIYSSNGRGYSYYDSYFGRIEIILRDFISTTDDISLTPITAREIDSLFQ